MFGFMGKHQCFKCDVDSYRKPVEGMQQLCGPKLQEVETMSCSCILDQLQGFDGPQRQICQDQVPITRRQETTQAPE